MHAIGQDEHGRADIDYDKCVNCGMCLVNCPFGAIVDKGQLFQLIHAIKKGDKVVAIIAPAFWGQFGDNVTPGQIREAMKLLGFDSLVEVAIGADLCAIEEAEEFLRDVPEKQPFMATSCRSRRTPAAGWRSSDPAPPRSWRPAAAPSAAMWTSC